MANADVLDIRHEDAVIDDDTHFIRFYDSARSEQATILERFGTCQWIFINAQHPAYSSCLESKEQTENLIKALQKAIELEWVK